MQTISNLQIHVETDEPSSAMMQVRSLKNWVESADLEEEVHLQQERKTLAADEAGGDWLTILGVALGSPLVHEFAKSVWDWYQQKSRRQPDLTITLTTPRGGTIRIEGNVNMEETAFVGNLVKLMQMDEKKDATSSFSNDLVALRQGISAAIGANQTQQAFRVLEDYLTKEPESNIFKILLIRKGEFARLTEEVAAGTIRKEEEQITRNRIHLVLLDLVTQLEFQQV